jgi:two-component system, response regulator PdtaR
LTDKIAVLVVEDETLILMDIVAQLNAEGFKTYEATNADAAVALLEAHPDIGLIFTDIDMPGSMDGLKLAAAVRDRWPPVKIIVTSGRHVVSEADMPEGMVFFGKPYDHSTIARSMRDMLKL